MPYFVYRISPPLQLEHLATIDHYQEARKLVRQHREAAGGMRAEVQYRMIFARQQAEAERVLSTPRDERVIGED